jgi:chromosome partitioning protein
MSHVICVVNFDEKSGKTSTVVNLAASLAVLEKKTLVVDCDPKGTASNGLVPDKDLSAFGLFDVLTGIVSGRTAVSETKLPYLDIIPTGDGLDVVEKSLNQNPEKEKILAIIIQKFKDHYDYILFDTPPEKGLLSQSAVMASDSILIPVKYGEEVKEGVIDALAYSGKFRSVDENPLKLSGILATRCPDLKDLGRWLNEMKNALLPVAIPEAKGSADPCLPSCLEDIKAPYSEAYLDLCYELLYRDGH